MISKDKIYLRFLEVAQHQLVDFTIIPINCLKSTSVIKVVTIKRESNAKLTLFALVFAVSKD